MFAETHLLQNIPARDQLHQNDLRLLFTGHQRGGHGPVVIFTCKSVWTAVLPESGGDAGVYQQDQQHRDTLCIRPW